MIGARPPAVAAFILVAATAAAHASPAEMFGFGARSPGMAGAGVATTADSESVYLNPAGLGEVDGRYVHFTSLVGNLDLDGGPARLAHLANRSDARLDGFAGTVLAADEYGGFAGADGDGQVAVDVGGAGADDGVE